MDNIKLNDYIYFQWLKISIKDKKIFSIYYEKVKYVVFFGESRKYENVIANDVVSVPRS